MDEDSRRRKHINRVAKRAEQAKARADNDENAWECVACKKYDQAPARMSLTTDHCFRCREKRPLALRAKAAEYQLTDD
jgi:hypothetical protein